ncbi:protein TolR [Moraxella bovis]|uniref:Protein TolR n=1 Tax=Moraxella bovis TaxID=476 RepID=A0AAQ2Q6F7_MORBO|nr:protein TolR [Moraxella bovis]AWY20151.1 protein TolR [Moraxella bovis]OOR90590.1 protein TolR [Moraxella bovis]UYZ74708.1 protein TolR [Moraxella bovis]UYZ79370.1 protein TolR [Moraxella bovis]UYZ80039.1 protein TolR [Moraxella bovis]
MKNSYTRAKKSLNSEMNVVPYIDVMLVLLIIFMVTAPMLTTGVEVNLPSEKTSNITKSELTPVIVSLTKDGELFVSHERAIDQAISESELSALLTDMAQANMGESGSQLQVLINADKDNAYEAVMHVMALVQGAGVTKVGLLSGQSSTKKQSSKK